MTAPPGSFITWNHDGRAQQERHYILLWGSADWSNISRRSHECRAGNGRDADEEAATAIYENTRAVQLAIGDADSDQAFDKKEKLLHCLALVAFSRHLTIGIFR